MDFDEAIRAHGAWKAKLSTYLRKPDGSLKAAAIQSDNQCDLGRWIYGEGAQFGSDPEFAVLKASHKKFHKAAAEVVNKADSGKSTSEDVALGSKSEFSTASANVVSAIMAIRRKAKSAGA